MIQLKNILTVVVAACSLYSVCFASAEVNTETGDKTQSIEEITVTASRTSRPLREVGSSVSILTSTDLQQKNYIPLADVLRTLPSISVSESGGVGKATSVFIRGEASYRTLLLIDGINVSDVSGVQVMPRFDQIQNSQLGRVEVLRGPQGMMYGADAGGVVNVFSKTAVQALEGELNLEAGSYDTQQASGNLRGRGDQFNYSITGSNLSSEGFNARDLDTENEKDGYNNATVHVKADYHLSDNIGLGTVIRNTDAKSEYDACYFFDGTAYSISNKCENEFEQLSGRVNAFYKDKKQGHEAAFSSSRTDNYDAELVSGVPSVESRGELKQWQYFGNYQFADEFNLEFGADLRSEIFTNFLQDKKIKRDQTGIYTEAQMAATNKFFYTIGARYDNNDDFGEHTSVRFASAYLVPVATGEMKIKGSYSTGFRSPSLFEVDYNNQPFIDQSAVPSSLKEETSVGTEVGLEWHSQQNTVWGELVLFENRIKDQIFFDLVNFAGYLQASGTSTSKGVEFSSTFEWFHGFGTSVNYTYNDTDLRGTSDNRGQRPRRPRNMFNIGLDYTVLQDRVTMNVFYRGAKNAVENESLAIDDYTLLDMNLNWKITDYAEIYLRGVNILDENYQEIPSYITANRSAYLGLRLGF